MNDCTCATDTRCPEAARLWAAADSVYRTSGYSAWLIALEPYNEHNARLVRS